MSMKISTDINIDLGTIKRKEDIQMGNLYKHFNLPDIGLIECSS